MTVDLLVNNVTVSAASQTQAGTFNDAYVNLTYTDVGLSFIKPIRVVFTAPACNVTSLTFAQSSFTINYLIGSGSTSQALPSVI